MMLLYSIILICSIIVPLAFSFEKKLQFYKQFKIILPSIIILALCYIFFDIYFTEIGIWGFNARYHSSILLFSLPIEEWLFFIVVPYASLFLHYSMVLYFPRLQVNDFSSKLFTIVLILFLSIVVLLNLDKTYTIYIFSITILALVLAFFDKTRILNTYYVSFLLILIPFILVNTILTGSFIEGEVIWYNEAENLQIRIFTIPIEDFLYAFSLILFNLLLIRKIEKLFFKNKKNHAGFE